MKIKLTILAIIFISFLIGFLLYPYMNDQMASHWNSQGQVNGYLPKYWGLFLLPLISLGIFLGLNFLPKIDPLKENYQQFRKYFDTFILVIIIFLFYLHLVTLLWNFGLRFNMIFLLLPALSGLIFYSGILLENVKQNWFVGIRTPWTLSNKEVWDKTHKLGSLLFKISAFLILVGLFFEKFAIYFALAPILISALVAILYSYIYFQRTKQT